MHYDTLKQVRRFHSRYFIASGTILEVGSRDAGNGSIRNEFPGCNYTGADISSGPGVDVVVGGSNWDMGKRFDVVLSCNTLEHVKDPWVLVSTMCRHVRPKGLIFLYAPFSHVYHRHPVDCYRYAPDGLRYLLESNGMHVVECYQTRSSNFVPLSYFTSTRLFLQHSHGCWLSFWRWLRNRNVPHISTVAVGLKE